MGYDEGFEFNTQNTVYTYIIIKRLFPNLLDWERSNESLNNIRLAYYSCVFDCLAVCKELFTSVFNFSHNDTKLYLNWSNCGFSVISDCNWHSVDISVNTVQYLLDFDSLLFC